MSECEIITILSELFNGVKDSSLVNLTRAEEHEIEMWLKNKLSEAAENEVREMKRERKSQELLGGEEIMEIATVCSNCHMPIKRGDFCCRQCQKLLVRQTPGGEE